MHVDPHADVRAAFASAVPELAEGLIEIAGIARGSSLTKVALRSRNPDIDPVGACIGTRGARVEQIVKQLGGRLDLIHHRSVPVDYAAAALAALSIGSMELVDGVLELRDVCVPIRNNANGQPFEERDRVLAYEGEAERFVALHTRLATELTGVPVRVVGEIYRLQVSAPVAERR